MKDLSCTDYSGLTLNKNLNFLRGRAPNSVCTFTTTTTKPLDIQSLTITVNYKYKISSSIPILVKKAPQSEEPVHIANCQSDCTALGYNGYGCMADSNYCNIYPGCDATESPTASCYYDCVTRGIADACVNAYGGMYYCFCWKKIDCPNCTCNECPSSS